MVFNTDYRLMQVKSIAVFSGKIGKKIEFGYCFHILVLQEYRVLAESRIPLKSVLGA